MYVAAVFHGMETTVQLPPHSWGWGVAINRYACQIGGTKSTGGARMIRVATAWRVPSAVVVALPHVSSGISHQGIVSGAVTLTNGSVLRLTRGLVAADGAVVAYILVLPNICARFFRCSTHHPTQSSRRACSTTVNPTSVYETMPRMGANGRGNQ